MDRLLAKWLAIVLVLTQILDEASATDALLRVGARQENDDLLFEYELHRPNRYFLQKQEAFVDFPMNAASDTPQKITMIDVEPTSSAISSLLSPNQVTVTNGGVGHDHVQLEFKSGLGRGLEYRVSIFGLKKGKTPSSGVEKNTGAGNTEKTTRDLRENLNEQKSTDNPKSQTFKIIIVPEEGTTTRKPFATHAKSFGLS